MCQRHACYLLPQCVAIARRALEEGDIAKAEKFVAKGQRLYSCREVRCR